MSRRRRPIKTPEYLVDHPPRGGCKTDAKKVLAILDTIKVESNPKEESVK